MSKLSAPKRPSFGADRAADKTIRQASGYQPLIFPKVLFQWGPRFEIKNLLHRLGDRVSQHVPALVKLGLGAIRAVSKMHYRDPVLPISSSEATNRTELAVKFFFQQVHSQITAGKAYPLAGLNKCLGFYAFPSSKKNKATHQNKPILVMTAISQDKVAQQDTKIRKRFIELLNLINNSQTIYRFKLVLPPTKEQYGLLRTLSMRIPGKAHALDIAPRATCVEPALAFAIAKAGRFTKLSAEDIAVIPVGAAAWANKTGDEVFEGFNKSVRNTTYVKKEPILVQFNHTHAYIDRWEPCHNHCQLYLREMHAIAASQAGDFLEEPIFEDLMTVQKYRHTKS